MPKLGDPEALPTAPQTGLGDLGAKIAETTKTVLSLIPLPQTAVAARIVGAVQAVAESLTSDNPSPIKAVTAVAAAAASGPMGKALASVGQDAAGSLEAAAQGKIAPEQALKNTVAGAANSAINAASGELKAKTA